MLYTQQLFSNERYAYKPETSTFQHWASSHSPSEAMNRGSPHIISQACDLPIKQAELIYFCRAEHKPYWHLSFIAKRSIQMLKLHLIKVMLTFCRLFFFKDKLGGILHSYENHLIHQLTTNNLPSPFNVT